MVATGYNGDATFSGSGDFLPPNSAEPFWTAVAERSGDTAFARTEIVQHEPPPRPLESGVALGFPPHSMTRTAFPSALATSSVTSSIRPPCAPCSSVHKTGGAELNGWR